jgi:hypothetical protein
MSLDESPRPLSTEHAEHVYEALRIIQEAQSLINEAARALCPVDGFADEWSASADVHAAIKEYWHRVNNRLSHVGRLSDSDAD